MGLWIPGGLSNSGGSSYVPCDWSTGSDEEIVEALEKHYAGEIDLHDYWSVGDERTVQLSAMAATTSSGIPDSHVAQSVVFILSNIGGKYLADGVTECCFQVDQKDCLLENGWMHNSGTTSVGWKNSKRRAWCNSTYKNAIPSTLRDIFKEFVNQSGLGDGSSSGVENTTDTFALRAEIEIFGSNTLSVSGEGSQVTWYETSANRFKQVNGSNATWWNRSSKSGGRGTFCAVNNGGSIMLTGNAGTNKYGLAPFGVI